MDVASGLSDHCKAPPPPCCSLSDDTHELGDDSSSAGPASILLDAADESPRAGRDRFSFRSRRRAPLPPLARLIFFLAVAVGQVPAYP
jgi:hypothetical protein